MKKKNFAVMLLVLLFVFSSCNLAPQSGVDGSSDAAGNNAEGKIMSPLDSIGVEEFEIGNIEPAQSSWYFAHDENNIYRYKNTNEEFYDAIAGVYHNDVISYIFEVELDGSGSKPLCNKQDCKHEDKTCNASASNNYESTLAIFGGNLYGIFTEMETKIEEGYSYRRAVNRVLQRRDTGGGAPINVCDIPGAAGTVRLVGFDGRYIFFTNYFYSEYSSGESVNVMLENGQAQTLKADEDYLMCVDIQTGEFKYAISMKNRLVMGVIDDKIVMQEMVRNDMGITFKTNVTLFSPGTGKEEVVVSRVSIYNYDISFFYSDGYYCAADVSNGEDNAKLIITDLRTKKETVLVEKIPGSFSGAYIFDGKLFYSYYKIAETGFGAEAVDIETKETQSAMHMFDKDYRVAYMLTVLMEYGESYIIYTPSGEAYLISKENYWNGIENMVTLMAVSDYNYY